tara:strand:+ start:58 stop:699 length:642 start_codon:yes stop_codon:yes gene_type:complete
MAIHTFGDSHVGETGQPDISKGFIGPCKKNGWPEDIKHHHMGPVLCNSFGTKGLEWVDISNFDLEEEDTLVFSFGEIDCRCHVYKHVNELQTYKDVIDRLINNYFNAIKANLDRLDITLGNVCVYNIPPPSRENDCPGIDTPYVGTDEERKLAYLYFNKLLNEKCQENRYIFINIYDKYTNKDGFIIRDITDGWVHIEDGIHLHEFLKKYNIK